MTEVSCTVVTPSLTTVPPSLVTSPVGCGLWGPEGAGAGGPDGGRTGLSATCEDTTTLTRLRAAGDLCLALGRRSITL